MRLLLVDDDEVDRILFCRATRRADLEAEIVEVGSGREARSLLAAETFDCIVLDYQLPDVTGLELLKDGHRPVVMLTGQGDEALAVEAMKFGAYDYVAKETIHPLRIRQAILGAMERHSLERALARYQADLEGRNRDLEALNQQKDRFFSIIAHDLRSPFNALLGLTSLLDDSFDSFGPQEAREFISGINETANKLYALVENLLKWSRLQMNAVEFEPQVLDLTEAVERTRALLDSAARNKGIALINAVPSQAVWADGDMLDTVLRNLVTNAIKFTDRDGRVTISASSVRSGWCVVSVADTGVGITDADLANLFRLDRKVSAIGTSGERGTGLGLLLCKDLVERHGGQITVESRQGEGSSFRFSLPLEPPDTDGPP